MAICDIDEGTLHGKGQKFSSARKFHDFRKLYDEMARHIDAVDDIVSTVVREHRAGDVVVLMSNGGFDDIHRKLLAAIEAR